MNHSLIHIFNSDKIQVFKKSWLFEKKTYLSYDAKTKKWDTVELNWIGRFLRNWFVRHKDTHQATIKLGLIEYCKNVKIFPEDKTINLINMLFKFKLKNQIEGVRQQLIQQNDSRLDGLIIHTQLILEKKHLYNGSIINLAEDFYNLNNDQKCRLQISDTVK